MNLFTTILIAMRALWRNKVRSLLTMLGIVFGIGAVIAMVSSGEGAQQAVREVFKNLGTNVLIVTNGSQPMFGAAGGAGSKQSLTWGDLEALRNGEIATIRWAAPVLQTRTQVASDQDNWNTTVIGTTSSWFKIRSWNAAQGNVFDEDTGDSSAKVAVVGKTVATQLFAGDAIGQTLRINSQPYEVVGVLVSKGQGPMGDNDDVVVIPAKTYQQKLSKGLAKYIGGQLLLSMTSDKNSEATVSQVAALLRDRHKLDAGQDDDFRVNNPTEFANAQQASTERISTLLAAIAAIALLVGGIGVMNIMLVSVIERTREVGIRMAVGAKPFDILLQFVVEALALTSIGGMLGIGLGALTSKYMAGYYGWQLFFPVSTAVMAFGISGAVGLVFGLYPAVRAAQLDPIAAVRYES